MLYTSLVITRRRFLTALLLFLLTAPLFAADRPLLVCFGDSITAGAGISASQAYPAALQRHLDQLGYRYAVVNRGTSGATTKDAVAALPAILKLHPAVVIVEFGGNDGLRGQPLGIMRANLDKVVRSLQAAEIKVLIAGITLPPNYGTDYIHAFETIYTDLATERRAAIVPMIYKDLVNVPDTIQSDGIHPTAKGSELIARTLLPQLTPLLRK